MIPILQHERTSAVDVLRGFALGGVVLANLATFSSFVVPAAVGDALNSTPADKVYSYIMHVFIDTKFITLFSLLFGYGFGVIMDRVSAKEVNPASFFTRRMLILLIVGVIHLCVWWGEILHMYALVGLLMLFFRKATHKTLLLWACFLLVIPTTAIRYLQIKTGIYAPAETEPLFTRYIELSRSSNLVDIVQANWNVYNYIFVQCLNDARDISEILGKFLLGYLVLRRGYLKNVGENKKKIQRLLLWCLPVALTYCGLLSWFQFAEIKVTNVPLRLALFIFLRTGILSLSTVYACTIVLLFHRWPRAKILGAMRQVGMMSLTNYLTHTVIFIVLLNGIGFALMGRLHMIETLYIGMAIYILQAFFSKWWLSRYQYGPAEWLWRQLSYRKRFPLKREPV